MHQFETNAPAPLKGASMPKGALVMTAKAPSDPLSAGYTRGKAAQAERLREDCMQESASLGGNNPPTKKVALGHSFPGFQPMLPAAHDNVVFNSESMRLTIRAPFNNNDAFLLLPPSEMHVSSNTVLSDSVQDRNNRVCSKGLAEH